MATLPKVLARTLARQGLERYPAEAAVDDFGWWAEADKGSPRTAWKNTAVARWVKRKARPASKKINFHEIVDNYQ